ncbi:sigma-54-dependent Fis family transcriptional regulator [bacterium]|nr:sigma-54-dependent Fis family transcriptional regulator [bacterium]
MQLKVLIVDDEIDTLTALKTGLESEFYQIVTSQSLGEALKILKRDEINIVITDLKLKDGSGMKILQHLQQKKLEIPVIIITAYGSVESAIDAIRGGAYDYLVKPFRFIDIRRQLDRLREIIMLRQENVRLRQQLESEPTAPVFIGLNTQFVQITELIRQIAPSRSTVLITGETGTGKEMAAKAIHHYSPRRHKSFVNINCGAIPENLLEAELFGFEPGAFTGAVKSKKGKIELAHEGTLFLDEISELTPAMQVKLLRVLQNSEFERLGGVETKKVDIRLIAATNVNLEETVENGQFREDLFYRLNVFAIKMLPLRERLDDIPLLVQYFISKYNDLNNKNIQGVQPDVLKKMLAYRWRGNIRELENMVERAVVLCQETMIKLDHMPMLSVGDALQSIPIEIGMSLSAIEKIVISRTLQFTNNDKQKTARILQISPATLYRKIKEYDLI